LNVALDTQANIGHSERESFQAVDCADTDNQLSQLPTESTKRLATNQINPS